MTTTTSAPVPAAPVAGLLASLSLSMLLPSLAISSANVALPTLARAFDASLAQLQWVVLAYLLATTSLIVGAGRLGDGWGRRRLLLVGLALFTMASLLCAWAPTLPLLVAARALQGAAAAALMALPMAMVGTLLPKARAGSAMGLLGSMSAVGTALGPSLGGLLIEAFGWPAVYAVNLPLGLLALLLVWRLLPHEPAQREAAALDLPGMTWLALTLAAYALAMTRHPALMAVALAGLLLFLRAERQASAPLLPTARLREPRLAGGLASNALVSAVMMATLVIGPFHLSGALGLGAAAVGALMSLGPIAAAVSGVPAGRLVDRWGAGRMAQAGLALMALGCGLIALLPASLGAAGYVAPLLLVTPGYALFQAANNTAVMAGAAGAQRGVFAGLLALSRNLGLITGASLMAGLFAAGGLAWSFGIAAALVLFTLVLLRNLSNANRSC